MKTSNVLRTMQILANACFIFTAAMFCLPQNTAAQSLSSIRSAERAVERAQEKVDEAQDVVNEAQKAVNDEIARLQEEAESDPSAHGTNEHLNELKEALAKAQGKLAKAKEKLEKAEEKLAREKEEFEEKQKRRVEEVLRLRPLPDDRQGLEDYKRELDSWNNDGWGSEEGEDLKRRLREKIDEKLRALESRRQVPDNGMRNSSGIGGFYIAMTGEFPLNEPEVIEVQPSVVYDAFYNTSTIKQLYENLGGEFFIGDPTGNEITGIDLAGKRNVIPGVAFGLQTNSGLEFGLRSSYFQTEWSGNFPVTVIPSHLSDRIQSTSGNINIVTSGILADAHVRYLFPGRTLRFYGEAGARGQLILSNNSDMILGGVVLPANVRDVDNALSPYAGAGARLMISDRTFIQAGISYAKVPDNSYTPGVSVGIGLNLNSSGHEPANDDIQFGVIDWIKDLFGPDYDNVKKADDFDKIRRTKYDKYVVEREVNKKSHEDACKAVDIDGEFAKACKRVYENEKKK